MTYSHTIKGKEALDVLDTCIETMRNEGLSDKTISLNLVTATGLVKAKKWDDFYHKSIRGKK